MKNLKNIFLAIFALCFATIFTSCGYNTMVEEREAVDRQWAEVENQYQRRYDLVPNLVATVKGYATHEESVFKEIADARAALGGTVTLDSSITDDPEKFEAFQKAQNNLGNSLGRLLALTESYPDLKANENFKDLSSQLEGTENRIATARNRYNEAVRVYNTAIQKFPSVITAKIFGFKTKSYFTADVASHTAPEVSF